MGFETMICAIVMQRSTNEITSQLGACLREYLCKSGPVNFA